MLLWQVEISGPRFQRTVICASMQDVMRIADYWMERGMKVTPYQYQVKSNMEVLPSRGGKRY